MAILVLPDFLVSKAQLDPLVFLELLECQDHPDFRAQSVLQVCLETLDFLDSKVQQVFRDLLDLKESREIMVCLGEQELPACLDLKDFPEHREQLEAKVVLVHKDFLVTLGPLVPQDFQVTADLLESMVYLEAPAHLDLPDLMVQRERQAFRDFPVPLDPTVSAVSKVLLAFLVLQADPELQEALVLLVVRVQLDLKDFPVLPELLVPLEPRDLLVQAATLVVEFPGAWWILCLSSILRICSRQLSGRNC